LECDSVIWNSLTSTIVTGLEHIQRTFVVTHYVLIIKPTRCTNFSNLFLEETLHVSDSSSVHHQEFFTVYTANLYEIYHCCVQWKTRASCQQTCMAYTTAVCKVKNSWWWTEELSETCRVSSKNKFKKLVHLVNFIIRIFFTMHGHLNVKLLAIVCSCPQTVGCSYAITVKRLNLWTFRDRRHHSEAFLGGRGGSKSCLSSVEVLDLSVPNRTLFSFMLTQLSKAAPPPAAPRPIQFVAILISSEYKSSLSNSILFSVYIIRSGVNGGTVSRDKAPQAGMSQVRFSLVSLGFFID